jgi:hypothetical protein
MLSFLRDEEESEDLSDLKQHFCGLICNPYLLYITFCRPIETTSLSKWPSLRRLMPERSNLVKLNSKPKRHLTTKRSRCRRTPTTQTCSPAWWRVASEWRVRPFERGGCFGAQFEKEVPASALTDSAPRNGVHPEVLFHWQASLEQLAFAFWCEPWLDWKE